MSYETINYDKQAQVAVITLNRPSAYNAFTEQLNKELLHAIKQATKDKEVRCVVLTGKGKAFCSGQDLAEVNEQTNHATFLHERYHPMLQAIKQSPKPVIAAVNGIAAGAGMSLALVADFRIMKQEAKFVSAFMNVGLVPDTGFLYELPRMIGYAKALEVAVLGVPITADAAKELGLVTAVYEAVEWEQAVGEFATRIAKLPTKAFSLIKRYMQAGMNQDYEELLAQEAFAQRIAGMSDDHQEGLQAFLEKRSPNFNGN
ncbi:enoyl-CoA hydratase/isomerase family protein [Ornithinibacillus contaminans]|uniref:enoyl-CoA hydratase/isomerase family protein n=1 Tax=Ornithinibacillus contaminans TaxID=694055 RepID=UPI00064D7C6E|nr:enoyl-CoA hydratase-related protein [Ornithinibacillus contaminans]